MNFFPLNQNQIIPNTSQANLLQHTAPLLVLQQPQCLIIYSNPFIQGNQIDNSIQQFTNNINNMVNHVNIFDSHQQIFQTNDTSRNYKYDGQLINNINLNFQQIGLDGAPLIYQSQSSIPQYQGSDMQGFYDVSNTLSSFAHLENQYNSTNSTQDRNSYLQLTPTSFRMQRNESISLNNQIKITPLSHLNEQESQIIQSEEIQTFQNTQIFEKLGNSTNQEHKLASNEIKIDQIQCLKKRNKQQLKQSIIKSEKQSKQENLDFINNTSQQNILLNNQVSSIKLPKPIQSDKKNYPSTKKPVESKKSLQQIQCAYKLIPSAQSSSMEQEQQNCLISEIPPQQEKTNLNNQQVNQKFSSQEPSINNEFDQENICEKNKLQLSQNEIINKILKGEQCSEGKIIKKFQLKDALQIVKQSIFNQKKDIIFEQKNLNPFKLRQSVRKNDEIVFAQIKESRRNNRLSKKEEVDFLKCKGDGSFQDHEMISEEEQEYDSGTNKQSLSIKQKAINDKDRKATSKFHNLKKLFMYKLIATFNMSNMMDIGVPAQIREAILKLMVKFKLSAKKSEEFNRKTEFFSQAHYNALFLHLTPKTITALSQNKFEVYLHKLIFSIDLEKISQYINNSQQQSNFNQSCQSTELELESENSSDCFKNHNTCCYEERIQYINILKRYCYQIVKNSNMFGINELHQNKQIEDNQHHLDQQIQMQSQDKHLNEQENMRMAYTFRALQGISNLNKGLFVKKF